MATTAPAVPMSVSFAAPFQQFNRNGARTLKDWQLNGYAKLAMGGLKLSFPSDGSSYQTGEAWTSTAQNLGLQDQLSAMLTFRLSSKLRGSETGGTLTFMVARSGDILDTDETSFFGVSPKFDGFAVVVRSDNSDLSTDRVSVWVNTDKSAKPRMIGSCYMNLRYDENRHDFDYSMSTSLRLMVKRGTVTVDVDTTSKGDWKSCMDVKDQEINVSRLNGGRLGLVGYTEEKSLAIDVSRLALYRWSEQVMSDDYKRKEETRPVQILHMLEHELFDINDRLKQTIEGLEVKMLLEHELISRLETSLTENLFLTIDNRLSVVERGIMHKLEPRISRSSHQLTGNFDTLLRQHNYLTDNTWMSPFVVIIVLLGVFFSYQRKQFKNLSKVNRNW